MGIMEKSGIQGGEIALIPTLPMFFVLIYSMSLGDIK